MPFLHLPEAAAGPLEQPEPDAAQGGALDVERRRGVEGDRRHLLGEELLELGVEVFAPRRVLEQARLLGELRQTITSGDVNLSEDDYLAIVEAKRIGVGVGL